MQNILQAEYLSWQPIGSVKSTGLLIIITIQTCAHCQQECCIWGPGCRYVDEDGQCV